MKKQLISEVKKDKAVIIGCGSRAGAHAAAYGLMERGKVVACAGFNAEKCKALAAQYGLKAYADAREMIASERPDIVHITTPPKYRLEPMQMVSDLGVPLCTVEKPIAVGVQDWRELSALEASSKTKFAVSHQLRWQRYLLKCQKALASGRLGEIEFIDLSAGMSISGQGTHILNYGRALAGDPSIETVFASASGWEGGTDMHPGPKATEAYVVFSNGVRCLWTTGSVSPRCGDPSTVWQHVRVAAYAGKGRVYFEEFGRWGIFAGGQDESGDFGGIDSWHAHNLEAQAAFHQAMFDWREKGWVPGTNLKDSLMEWAAVLALYQSAVKRKPVSLSKFNPDDNLLRSVSSL